MSIWQTIKNNNILKILLIILFSLIIMIVLFTSLKISYFNTVLLDGSSANEQDIIEKSFDSIMTMLSINSALVSSMIALLIPFIMKTLDEKEKKHDEEHLLEDILVQIKNIIVYYTHLWHEYNDEEEHHKLLERLKKSSILSILDFLEQNKSSLYKLGISLKIGLKEIDERKPQDVSADIYEIILMDYFYIRLNVLRTEPGSNLYHHLSDCTIYNINKITYNDGVDPNDYAELFKKIMKICEKNHGLTLEFNPNTFIICCKNCKSIKHEKEIYSCLTDKKQKEPMRDVCQSFKKGFKKGK